MSIKPLFKYNASAIKSSCDRYRNIKGIHYSCWTSDKSTFAEEKEKAKKQGLRTKIINGELYLEKTKKNAIARTTRSRKTINMDKLWKLFIE
jgi:hypothetical protein